MGFFGNFDPEQLGITALGLGLAPFTGGLSLAASGGINAARSGGDPLDIALSAGSSFATGGAQGAGGLGEQTTAISGELLPFETGQLSGLDQSSTAAIQARQAPSAQANQAQFPVPVPGSAVQVSPQSQQALLQGGQAPQPPNQFGKAGAAFDRTGIPGASRNVFGAAGRSFDNVFGTRDRLDDFGNVSTQGTGFRGGVENLIGPRGSDFVEGFGRNLASSAIARFADENVNAGRFQNQFAQGVKDSAGRALGGGANDGLEDFRATVKNASGDSGPQGPPTPSVPNDGGAGALIDRGKQEVRAQRQEQQRQMALRRQQFQIPQDINQIIVANIQAKAIKEAAESARA